MAVGCQRSAARTKYGILVMGGDCPPGAALSRRHATRDPHRRGRFLFRMAMSALQQKTDMCSANTDVR